jgi:hypothetical protein
MTTTNPTTYYVIGAIIVIIAVVVAIAISRRAQSARLQRRFGPEYDRLARKYGGPADAERELVQREKRVKTFKLAELSSGARERYAEEWRHVQAHFVDEPVAALVQADALIVDVMRDRGYPVANFEQRTDDLSADHGRTIENYRTAHAISTRAGATDTEDLRQAMVHYRTVFDELVGTTERTNA